MASSLHLISKVRGLKRQAAALRPSTKRKQFEITAAHRAAWEHDPERFASEALGVSLWSRQAEIAQSVDEHDSVAVRSGHKTGKSRIAAVLAIWWAVTRENATVIMTAAGGRQVERVLWKEIKGLCRKAKAVLPTPAKLPSSGMEWANGNEIFGFSTDEPEKMAGYSGANLLFLLDEASGIPEAIFEAIEGNRAAGAKLVMFSNPTQTSGTFYEAFTTKREFWHCIQVSSRETPNVVAGKMLIPGLAGPDWVAKKLKEWGEGSPLFDVRVEGNFPRQGSNAVIGVHLVSEARKRFDIANDNGAPDNDVEPEGILEIGVDVARFGDDESVAYPVRGKRTLEPSVCHGFDTVEVAGMVMELAKRLYRPGERQVVIRVDTLGYGAGVADILRHQIRAAELPFRVVDVQVSEKPTADEPPFNKLRDQLWWALRDFLGDAELYEDPALEAELVAPTYGFAPTGAIKVESKEDIKKRLKRSPDRADALALAVYRYGAGPLAIPPTRPSPPRSRWHGMGGRGF